jgi:precorrin-6B methylase 2
MILTCFQLVIILLIVIGLVNELRTGVPTVDSFPASRRKIVEALQKYLHSQSTSHPLTIIDLGSGNGQLGIKVAHAFPSATVIGIELSFLPWLYSVMKQKVLGPKNATFICRDFWPYDCSKVDGIVLYINGAIVDRMSKKLREELKPGAIIVTNEIPLSGDWQPVEIIETNFFKMKVYVFLQK